MGHLYAFYYKIMTVTAIQYLIWKRRHLATLVEGGDSGPMPLAMRMKNAFIPSLRSVPPEWRERLLRQIPQPRSKWKAVMAAKIPSWNRTSDLSHKCPNEFCYQGIFWRREMIDGPRSSRLKI